MLNAKELDVEIAQREIGPSTMQTVEQLALLYIVRDHLYPKNDERPAEPPEASQKAYSSDDYSRDYEPISEFADLALSVPKEDLIYALEEHMEAIRMLYPKEYDAVMRRLDAAIMP